MVHHEFKKGQKVLVIKKDGTKIVGKYLGCTRQFLQLENNYIEWKNIRSSTIFKKQGETK